MINVDVMEQGDSEDIVVNVAPLDTGAVAVVVAVDADVVVAVVVGGRIVAACTILVAVGTVVGG